tara:strand:+ start:82 stop:276 length:195 start_codon:yes stop_codon:yes gene_type:complete
MTITYPITGDQLTTVATLCGMASVRPLCVLLNDDNVSVEFRSRDNAIRFTEEYLGSKDVSAFID